MALMPQEPLGERINDLMEDGQILQKRRPYMGYSGLGGKCKRKVWYDFRWAYNRSIDRRLNRLFRRGDWEEGRIVADLKHAGIKFHSEQKQVVGLANHVKGHIDGLLENVPGLEGETVLAEFKTANDKNFKLFKKKGCREANPTYYYQAQAYMGELGLKYCLFIVTNKNDECRYIEIIEFDQGEFKYLQAIALEILSTDEPPEKIGGATWFDCKYCDAYMHCHFNDPLLKNCRTCHNGTIEDNGVWTCGGNFDIDLVKQGEGCEDHKFLKGLR